MAMVFSFLVTLLLIISATYASRRSVDGIILLPIRHNHRRQAPKSDVFDKHFAMTELRAVLTKYKRARKLVQSSLTSTLVVASPSGQETRALHVMPNFPSISPFPQYPGKAPAELPNLPQTTTGIMPLRSFYHDYMYYGPVQIGTPPQNLTIDIDTGSADMWIPVNCPQCDNTQFDSSASSTYSSNETSFEVYYEYGWVSGSIAMDTVSIAGFAIPNQTFGAVTTLSSDMNAMPSDGLLGLAFSASDISYTHAPTFFENLIERREISADVFSVYLTRRKEEGSEVCFGCVDGTKWETGSVMRWIELHSRVYWSVVMDGVSLKDDEKVDTQVVAAIDTGTTLIYVPEEVATGFYTMIPGAKRAVDIAPGYWSYPCSTDLTGVALWFSNQRFSVHPEDFNQGRMKEGSTECVGGIVAVSSQGFGREFAVVGSVFMKNWYTTFDYSGRIGFAPSINNA